MLRLLLSPPALLRTLCGDLRLARTGVPIGERDAAEDDQRDADELGGRDAADHPGVRTLELDQKAPESVQHAPDQEQVSLFLVRPASRDHKQENAHSQVE